MQKKIDVHYYRKVDMRAPIFNHEKTTKKVSLCVTGGVPVAVRINGTTISPHVIYNAGSFGDDYYLFFVSSGDTYQVITEDTELMSWREEEYTPEVSG